MSRRLFLFILGGWTGWAAAQTVVPDGLGVNIHFTDPRPGEMKMLADAGFTYVRMDLNWGGTEREKGKYDFRAYDRLLAALDPHSIRALLILDYRNRFYDNDQSPCSDEGRQAFAHWSAAAVQHFKGRGVLWEMYNEPNIHFWKPAPNVTNYIALAREVGQAIRQVAPREQYIGPATSLIDFKFLEPCFQAGLLDYWTAVSVHPYRQKAPETVLPEYARLRAMIDKYAPQGKRIPIISGEWGYSAAWKKFDDELQGKYLPRELLVNLLSGVPVSIWYDWHDDGTDPQEPEHHFGIVRHQYFKERDPIYDAKPAYVAMQTLVNNLRGYHFAKRLDTGSTNDYVLAFSKGWRTQFVAWTTGQPHDATLPAPVGRIALTDTPQYLLAQFHRTHD